MSRRQEMGNDRRGNPRNRRARKLWMLSTPIFGGDGVKVACVHCGAMLTYETVQADRIIPGGSYRRDNVQPSCRIDNILRSDNADWVAPLARTAA